MNTTTTRTVTLKDTGEVIDGVTVLVDDHLNDGYDWMELIGEHGWAVIPGWGCDGWDLGQWPYVMVAGIRTADAIGNLFGVATYCEGDVTCAFFRTKARWWDEISRHAHFGWTNGQAQGPEDLPENAADMPAKYRQPCTVFTAS